MTVYCTDICCCHFPLSLLFYFFFKEPATTEIYTYGHTLSLLDALPIFVARARDQRGGGQADIPEAEDGDRLFAINEHAQLSPQFVRPRGHPRRDYAPAPWHYKRFHRPKG